jgi:hypothetical protein
MTALPQDPVHLVVLPLHRNRGLLPNARWTAVPTTAGADRLRIGKPVTRLDR